MKKIERKLHLKNTNWAKFKVTTNTPQGQGMRQMKPDHRTNDFERALNNTLLYAQFNICPHCHVSRSFLLACVSLVAYLYVHVGTCFPTVQRYYVIF